MNKRIQSCIVILFTIFCVLIILFSDQINDKANLIKNKILVINKKYVNPVKEDNTISKNKDIKNNDSTKKKVEVHKDITSKDNITVSAVTSEKYKKFKMERMNDELVQDKEIFFSQGNIKENTGKQNNSVESKKTSVKQSNENSVKQDDKGSNGENSTLKEDTPVFKVSRSEINDKLTISDKTKLLSIASKLSAVDYEKVTKYLQSGSDQDIKNTVKLLKERLSEKDYDKAKEVAKKIINMDVVEQWTETPSRWEYYNKAYLKK